jgi:hypothetical protein
MAGFLAGLRVDQTRSGLRGWRNLVPIAVFVAILAALPQARALLTTGLLGGVIIGICLILARHQPGPRRGTPITLFPRPVSVSVTRAEA